MKFFDFYEIKREAKRYDRVALEQKAEAFFEKNPALRDWKITFSGLSLKNV